jgi:predicted Zn finger-like uncharacterized protein
MIVTCPACSTRYLVDPRALGSAGRIVRCAQCGQTWHQTPPEDAPRTLEIEPEDAALPRLARQRPQLPAVPPKQRQRGATAILAACVFVVVLLAVTAVVARDSVIQLWPPAADLYQKVGLRTTPPGPVFEIRKTTPSLDKVNGVPVVVVEGEIANISGSARDVPKLKIILKDKNGKAIEQKVVAVSGPRLLPGASVPFRTSIPQPATAATSVVVMIDGEG